MQLAAPKSNQFQTIRKRVARTLFIAPFVAGILLTNPMKSYSNNIDSNANPISINLKDYPNFIFEDTEIKETKINPHQARVHKIYSNQKQNPRALFKSSIDYRITPVNVTANKLNDGSQDLILEEKKRYNNLPASFNSLIENCTPIVKRVIKSVKRIVELMWFVFTIFITWGPFLLLNNLKRKTSTSESSYSSDPYEIFDRSMKREAEIERTNRLEPWRTNQ